MDRVSLQAQTDIIVQQDWIAAPLLRPPLFYDRRVPMSKALWLGKPPMISEPMMYRLPTPRYE